MLKTKYFKRKSQHFCVNFLQQFGFLYKIKSKLSVEYIKHNEQDTCREQHLDQDLGKDKAMIRPQRKP
jgi:hypothetical protein